MQLQNPFPLNVRWLFFDCRFMCFMCGANGWKRGGMELHHITGRDSDSAFNAAPLCKVCHDAIKHTQEEERELTSHTLQWLQDQKYQPIEKDWQHLLDHPWLVIHNKPV